MVVLAHASDDSLVSTSCSSPPSALVHHNQVRVRHQALVQALVHCHHQAVVQALVYCHYHAVVQSLKSSQCILIYLADMSYKLMPYIHLLTQKILTFLKNTK